MRADTMLCELRQFQYFLDELSFRDGLFHVNGESTSLLEGAT